jgi:hypothetical protein
MSFFSVIANSSGFYATTLSSEDQIFHTVGFSTLAVAVIDRPHVSTPAKSYVPEGSKELRKFQSERYTVPVVVALFSFFFASILLPTSAPPRREKAIPDFSRASLQPLLRYPPSWPVFLSIQLAISRGSL